MYGGNQMEGRKLGKAVSAHGTPPFGDLLLCRPTLKAQLSWCSGYTGQESSIVEIGSILVRPLNPHATAQGFKAGNFPYSAIRALSDQLANSQASGFSTGD
jgi:hypothetical protein